MKRGTASVTPADLAQALASEHPRVQLPHRRRGAAVERGPRLCLASHRAACDAPWHQVRPGPRVLPQSRADARGSHGQGVSGARHQAEARQRGVVQGGRAVRAHSRDRHANSRRCHRQARQEQDHRRQHRLQAPRHLRFPDRSDGRHRARARARRGHGRLRARDGRAAPPVPGREPVRRRSVRGA